MKIVVQRSKLSRVIVNGKILGEIPFGMVCLICFEQGDENSLIDQAIQKILHLRIFVDENNKMNRNILEVKGHILCISQFTLSWDGKKGNRPSFDKSLAPIKAQEFYHLFCHQLQKYTTVATGEFAADMLVEIQNDGPVTFTLSFCNS